MLLDCDSHSSALLDLFISSSDANICSTMAFPALGNSDHVAVSVSIGFPANSKQDAPFYRITSDYSRIGWDVIYDRLRDVPWEDTFKIMNFVSGFKLELVYISFVKLH